MRRAVSRAAPLAYQHSLMIFPITRSDCTGKERKDRKHVLGLVYDTVDIFF